MTAGTATATLNATQVARLAGCQPITVTRAIREGRLPGRKVRVGALQYVPPCRRRDRRQEWAIPYREGLAWASSWTDRRATNSGRGPRRPDGTYARRVP